MMSRRRCVPASARTSQTDFPGRRRECRRWNRRIDRCVATEDSPATFSFLSLFFISNPPRGSPGNPNTTAITARIHCILSFGCPPRRPGQRDRDRRLARHPHARLTKSTPWPRTLDESPPSCDRAPSRRTARGRFVTSGPASRRASPLGARGHALAHGKHGAAPSRPASWRWHVAAPVRRRARRYNVSSRVSFSRFGSVMLSAISGRTSSPSPRQDEIEKRRERFARASPSILARRRRIGQLRCSPTFHGRSGASSRASHVNGILARCIISNILIAPNSHTPRSIPPRRTRPIGLDSDGERARRASPRRRSPIISSAGR